MALIMVKEEGSCIINGFDDDVVPTEEERDQIKKNINRILTEAILRTQEITA